METSDPELKKKASDFTLEWAKNVTAIASAALVLSATFIKEIAQPPLVKPIYIQIAWMLLLVSVVSGVIVVSALVGQLNKGDIRSIDVYASAIRMPALLQAITLLGGMLLLALFAWANF
jgi:hypothetical protein